MARIKVLSSIFYSEWLELQWNVVYNDISFLAHNFHTDIFPNIYLHLFLS